MRVVVQKVSYSSVTVANELVSEINKGLNVLVGFTDGDTSKEIFEDENGVMNKSVQDVKGSILLISQFTLYGDASKGNRPSYIKALGGDKAEPLYEEMAMKLNKVIPTFKGVFGADMNVVIHNDGPTTIIIDSK